MTTTAIDGEANKVARSKSASTKTYIIWPSVFGGFGFGLTARGGMHVHGARFLCFNFFLAPNLKFEGPIKGLTCFLLNQVDLNPGRKKFPFLHGPTALLSPLYSPSEES